MRLSALVLLLSVLLTSVALLSLVACAKEGDTNLALPTVQNQAAPLPESQGSFIGPCYADHGRGPVKYIHVQESQDRRNICFRDGVCYYGCKP